MVISKLLSRQARKPSGLFGKWIIVFLFDKGNAELNRFVSEMVDIREKEHVLEIGFGTGFLIRLLSKQIKSGVIEEIDFSKTMFSVALKKNRKQIQTGKVKLSLGNFDEVPFEKTSFDKIFTVNTLYFWENPSDQIKKIATLLKSGGTILIAFEDETMLKRKPLDPNVFNYYSKEAVVSFLSQGNQFTNVHIESRKLGVSLFHCITAVKI